MSRIDTNTQEEGGYEEAAYHPGSKPAGQEAHLEEGLLYQPLEAEAGGPEGKPGAGVLRLCSDQRTDAMAPCARYASLLGEISNAWHWVKHHAHKLIATAIAGVSSLVIGATGALATSLCGFSAAATADPLEAFDCGRIAAIIWTVFAGGVGSTIAAWKETKN